MEELVTVGRETGPRGEIALRRRGEIEELVVNGTFAMDSAETRSERELGRLARGAERVLVGGLGLGCTVAAVLDEADHGSTDVALDVVELEHALVAWAREGRTETLGRVAADPRVRLHVADVATVLAGRLRGPGGPVGRDPAGRRQRAGLPHPRRERRPLRRAGPARRVRPPRPGRRARDLVPGAVRSPAGRPAAARPRRARRPGSRCGARAGRSPTRSRPPAVRPPDRVGAVGQDVRHGQRRRPDSGPSTTRWARSSCRGTRCGRRRPSAPWRTSPSRAPRSSRPWSPRSA